MNIFKKRISLILGIVMLSLAIIPMVSTKAASNTDIGVEYNGKTYIDDGVKKNAFFSVEDGSTVKLKSLNSNKVLIAYGWDIKQDDQWVRISNKTEFTTTALTGANGSAHSLHVLAANKNNTSEGMVQSVYRVYIRDNSIPQVSLKATMNGKTLTPGTTYQVKGGETVNFSASTIISTAKISWIAVVDGNATKVTEADKHYSSTYSMTIPKNGAAGQKISYLVEPVADNDDYSENTITKTGWKRFIFQYEDNTVDDKDINVALNGKNLTEGSTTEANPNESLKITATPTDRVSNLYFKWDNDAWSKVANTSSYATRIPSSFLPGSTHKLYVKAEYDDGEVISEKVYIFKIPATASNITMNVKLDSKTIYSGKSYNVVGKEKVTVTVSASNTTADYIKYRFGNQSEVKVSGAKATITVPTKNVGTRLNLYVQAFGKDGSQTAQNVYTLVYVRNNDGKLDIEPWMEENDELVSLVVNLRNDSEEADKANKNIYALDEVVTYYVDYKNGTGDDITSEVKLVLELPLDFDVVDANGGQVDKDKNTITWVFPDGLEDEEAGTKIVSIKYTSLSKSKYTSERIYPTAGIYRANKEKDRSTVINLIVRDYDEKVKTTHEPYMRGDANKDTFRPNDYITRAEGALVLARIYGLDYMNTRVTDVFSDLDETYLEAQKAIIAASKAGLINGYTNGTFKPNAKMTRAEFIKILACMVEMNADDEEIEGLEIKDVEDCIKVYNDSTRYYIVDGKKVYTHWALEEVTLLARLNMLPLSEDEDEIKLDKEITRAEVAQLVNFYLLRAPASVDSKTKSGFSDVSRRHELFADIIEATREEHEFSMNEDDGTEVAE